MKFLDASTPLPEGTLWLGNTEDVLVHRGVPGAAGVALDFPKWTDGRAYSQAVLLRGRLRYRGEIIATGDIVADMMPLLRRCGFDSVCLRADQKRETAERALGHIEGRYQRSLAERHAETRAERQSEGAAS